MRKQVKPKKVKPYLFHHSANVPLIECTLHLIVTSDLAKCVNSKDFHDIFPRVGHFEDHGYYGCTFYDYDLGRVAIVLAPEGTNHNVVNHEIHHATHHIGNHIGCKHDPVTSEEFYAQICGFVGDFIYRQIEDWGVKLTRFDQTPTAHAKALKSAKTEKAKVKKATNLRGHRQARKPKAQPRERKRPSR